MEDKTCDERLISCTKRMDSHAVDINKIFSSKASKEILLWTLAIFFVLICGSYTYTKTVSDEVSKLVTQKDMEQYQQKIIDAINER